MGESCVKQGKQFSASDRKGVSRKPAEKRTLKE
jgi:hypothetical protein